MASVSYTHLKRSILRFIIELARWMNLQVIAEGVETEEQMQKLLAIKMCIRDRPLADLEIGLVWKKGKRLYSDTSQFVQFIEEEYQGKS